MKIRVIYIALLSVGLFARAPLFAQSVIVQDDEHNYTIERIESQSGWLSSFNPAGLAENFISKSLAEGSYGYSFGPYRNLNEGSSLNTLGLRTESYKRLNALSFYGKLEYRNDRWDNVAMRGNIYPEMSLMPVGDIIPGEVRQEFYMLDGGVAYELCYNWVLGCAISYEAASLAKRKDARNVNMYMNFNVQPGVMYRSRSLNAGLNFNFHRTTESVGYDVFGTNETNPLVYFLDGMWFYRIAVVNSTGTTFAPIRYKGSTFGAAAQLEFKFSPDVKFMNQFSMDYDYMHRYRHEQMEKIGDDEKLIYKYLGTLGVYGSRTDNIIKVNLGYRDVAQYHNIQEAQVIEGTTTLRYIQFGKVKKFSGTVKQAGAEYLLFVKRNSWNSSWIVNIGADYYKHDFEYRILPALFRQDIEVVSAKASVTKNFILCDKAMLDITVNGGIADGSGTPFTEIIPEGLDISMNIYEEGLMHEFNYLTSKRYDLGGKVRYTHELPTKFPMNAYAEFAIRSTSAKNGMPDTFRRGVMGTIGINF